MTSGSKTSLRSGISVSEPVRDKNGEPIPEVLPGYKLIPGFAKYEINRAGEIRYAARQLHRPIKGGNGPYNYVSLSNDDDKVRRRWVKDLIELAFPS